MPDQPPVVSELRSNACESLTVRWNQPPDLTASQVAFYSLVISQGAHDGGILTENVTLRGETSYTSPALLAATTFGAEVRANNPLGVSQWSERLIATTPLPERSPITPPAPLATISERSCDVRIKVQLPRARTASSGDGCAGAEHFELQTLAAGSTSWRTLASRSTATSLTVHAPVDLSAAKAHRFRVVSANRIGSSQPSEATASLVAGLPLESLKPPVVLPTSSASFKVQLPVSGAPCLEDLVWTILGRVEHHDWRVLGTGSQGSSVAIEQLRCPKQGCEFKLQPDVAGFGTDIETPSVFASNGKLPVLEARKARVEVRLNGAEWNSLVRSQLRHELVPWLGLRSEPEVVEGHVNEHAGDTALVIDLPEPRADDAAQRLANLLSDRTAQMPESSLIKRLQRSTGVQMQDANGKWHPLLPRPPEKDDLVTWGPVSVSLVALLVIGVCARCALSARAAWRRRRELNGAIPLAMSEEDAEEDERDPRSKRQSRVATVDLNHLDADDDFPA